MARYICEYFIDKNTESYLKIKFHRPRANDNDLGFKEWRKELAKTSKQRKEEKKLFLEECRRDTIEMIKRINENIELDKQKQDMMKESTNEYTK